jgi:hypothetical protein
MLVWAAWPGCRRWSNLKSCILHQIWGDRAKSESKQFINYGQIWNIAPILYQIFANLAGFSVFIVLRLKKTLLNNYYDSPVKSFPLQIYSSPCNLISLLCHSPLDTDSSVYLVQPCYAPSLYTTPIIPRFANLLYTPLSNHVKQLLSASWLCTQVIPTCYIPLLFTIFMHPCHSFPLFINIYMTLLCTLVMHTCL